ncbi:HNH endonuclease [Saccharospirillum sp.]|uniref:HNH endonuclease n=1 Tax=Saccharospirillum sp. TaxID=2033801 RepID=UPI00349FD610
MKKIVEKAFVDFDAGLRPEGYMPARNWFVISSSGRSYPAKAIWAMAVNEPVGQLHTYEARLELTKLEYSVINAKLTTLSSDFDKQVKKSQSDSSEERKKRIEKAPKKPSKHYSVTVNFIRNPDVVAEVLDRAKGRCEGCRAAAPFNKKKDGSPYLEVHHIKQLSKGGEDTIKNAIALCPNCHRKQHYG